MSSPTSQQIPWQQNPTLTALAGSLQITADCWNLLAGADGTSRKQHYLPQGEREPESAYRKRLEAARPSGFLPLRAGRAGVPTAAPSTVAAAVA